MCKLLFCLNIGQISQLFWQRVSVWWQRCHDSVVLLHAISFSLLRCFDINCIYMPDVTAINVSWESAPVHLVLHLVFVRCAITSDWKSTWPLITISRLQSVAHRNWKKAVNIKLSCLKTTVTCPCLLWTTSWQSLGSQETSAQHSGSPRSKIFLWVVLASLTKRKLSDKWCIGRKTHIIKANTQNKVATTRPLPST